MGYYCTVPQCTSLAGKTKNVKFHRFPRDVTMADKWNMILKRGKPYTKYSKVCSLHFTQADYNVTTMGQWKTLSKDAVPSQNLPKLNPDGTVMVIRKSRTVKYKEPKKDEPASEKAEKWTPATAMAHHQSSIDKKEESWPSMTVMTHLPAKVADPPRSRDTSDSNVPYRLQTLNSIANNISPQQTKPKKQDAFMQTDPLSEDEETPNNSYSDVSDKSFNEQYSSVQYQKEPETFDSTKNYEPKNYTKTPEDYIPQTNEEYNKEAEKYALERKAHNGYEKPLLDSYQKNNGFQKSIPVDNEFPKITDVYSNFDKDYQNRPDYVTYQNNYPDSVELLRNQQHNLQMLQEQHRINENQNFFNESHIKQEANEEDKYLYDRPKDQIDAASKYDSYQEPWRRLRDHVKEEPETPSGCDNVMQPQDSAYYPANGLNNVAAAGGYYEASRPGPELLIAKQNALAAQTQLWQNTMKRPFFYSENPHYNGTHLLQRYEDLTRILQ